MFEKVSFNEFKKSMEDNKVLSHVLFSSQVEWETEVRRLYDHIALPARATNMSAGYDFYSPCSMTLYSRGVAVIPTGIRCKMPPNHMLMIVPRSSFGIKKDGALLNTIGIIDGDYYYSDNEGHIMAVIQNRRKDHILHIDKGERFIQGIVVPYFTFHDEILPTESRCGGLGSTGV